MLTKEILRKLEKANTEIFDRIIKDLIQNNENERTRVSKLYREYTGDVAIKNRSFDDNSKLNNQLPNDFRGDIIDGIVGYMFSEPITYEIDKSYYKEGASYKAINDKLQEFLVRNSIDDLDSTTGEMMSICGYAARLLYVDAQGQERVMNIDPWEVIVIRDKTLDETQYAMIYYKMEIEENGKVAYRTKVEWYDKTHIYYFLETEKGNYIPDPHEPKNPRPHMFSMVPVVLFKNNNALKGDFEKVNDLIDAYDRTISDIQNEIEEFRLAYFAFYGVEIDEETIRQARKKGAFGFPEGTSGDFLIKPLDKAVQFIENHKKTLNENIYKFSKTVDMTDEKFSGSAQTGESRKWKLAPLENKAKAKERKFTKALREQFRILATAWEKKSIVFDVNSLSFQFSRNIPVDLKYHAETTEKYQGRISEKTRLSLLPFIADPEAEIEQMKSEQEQDILINFE